MRWVSKTVICIVLLISVFGWSACGSNLPFAGLSELLPIAEGDEDNYPVEFEAQAGQRVFRIVREGSEVRFTLDEILLGKPTTVVGTTSWVRGSILVDLEKPKRTRVGTIRIDARDLTTDNKFRNEALRTAILKSGKDEYQYIIFTPIVLDGLPNKVAVGEEMVLEITGNLAIKESTYAITFDVTVLPVSETELHVTGKTVISRADFDLVIPNVPGVANVADEVKLSFDLVAIAVE